MDDPDSPPTWLVQAFRDWNADLAFLDDHGRYRIYNDPHHAPTKRSHARKHQSTPAPWADQVRAAYPQHLAFHKAAENFRAHENDDLA